MMAAAQPFISGAISKTVNMPHECTVEEIRDTYVQAWKMGLKCVAIYRDGSKRSQPLNTKKTNDGGDKTAANGTSTLEARIKELEAEVIALRAEAGKPLRRRLSDTRTAVTHKFDIAGHEGYLTVGLFERRPARRTVHHDGQGRFDHRRFDGQHRHAHQHGVAIRRAAGSPRPQIRAPAVRAERLHQKPRYPQRRLHHRLCVPLDGVAIHSRLPSGGGRQSRPTGTGHPRVARRGKKKGEPSGA